MEHSAYNESLRADPLVRGSGSLCTDPDVTWGSGRGFPLVVHFWADLQSVQGLRYYGNIM